MRCFAVLLIAVILPVSCILAQSTTWSKSYSFSGFLHPHSICEGGNGFYTLSETSSGPIGLSDLIVSSKDQNGEVIWTKAIGSSFIESGRNAVIIELSSGNIAITGYWKSSPNSNRRMFLSLLDNTGQVLWSITPEVSTENDSPRDLVELENGNIIWVGSTVTNSFGATDGFIVCLNPSGQVLWSTHYGGSQDDHFYSVIQSSNGDIIVAGNSQSFDYVHHGLMCRYSPTGDLLNEKLLLNSDLELFFGLDEADNGEIMVGGYTTSITEDTKDIWFCKLNNDFELLWSKAVLGVDNDSCTDVNVQGNEFMLFCNTESYAALGSSDVLCLSFNLNTAELLTARVISHFGHHSIEEVSRTSLRNGNSFFTWSKIVSAGTTTAHLTKSHINSNESCLNQEVNPNIIELETTSVDISMDSGPLSLFIEYPMSSQQAELQVEVDCEVYCTEEIQIEILTGDCSEDLTSVILESDYDENVWEVDGELFQNLDSLQLSGENSVIIDLTFLSAGCEYDTSFAVFPLISNELFDDTLEVDSCYDTIILQNGLINQPYTTINPEIPLTISNDTIIQFTIANSCYEADVSVHVNVFQPLDVIQFSPQNFCDSAYLEIVMDQSNSIILNDELIFSDTTIYQPGTYSIQLIDSIAQCEEIIDFEIVDFLDGQCDECLEAVYVPNAFTPNNDGINDVFQPVISCNIDDYRLQIFNRWGEQIFTSTFPEQFWVGNVKGSDHYAINGVYAWILEVNGHKFRGHVVMLR